MMFPGNKDELERLNKEIKKDASSVRAKLKCKWRSFLLNFCKMSFCTVDFVSYCSWDLK